MGFTSYLETKAKGQLLSEVSDLRLVEVEVFRLLTPLLDCCFLSRGSSSWQRVVHSRGQISLFSKHRVSSRDQAPTLETNLGILLVVKCSLESSTYSMSIHSIYSIYPTFSKYSKASIQKFNSLDLFSLSNLINVNSLNLLNLYNFFQIP